MRYILLFLLALPAFPQMLQGIVGGKAPAAAAETTARLFDGASGEVFNAATYLQSATSFTIATWVKSGSTTQTNRYLATFQNGGTAMIYGFVNDGGTSQVEFFCPNCSGTSPRTGSQITIADTNWHHVAYRYNGTTWDKFLDGAKTSISASISFTMPATQNALYLGSSAASSNYYSGSLARYYMSSSALTDGQISAMAGSICSTSGVSGTIGYWLLGSGASDTESSPSGNTNTLTLRGTSSVVTGPSCSSQ